MRRREPVEPEHVAVLSREVIGSRAAHRAQTDDGDIERPSHRGPVSPSMQQSSLSAPFANAGPRWLPPP